MKYKSIILVIFISALLPACDQAPQQPVALQYTAAPIDRQTSPTYSFAVHPLYNPQKLSEAYQPLINILNREIQGAHFELEASRDYQAYELKFDERKPAVLLPNPWQTLKAMKVGYHVIAMAGDAEDFRGCFIVRKDSGINTPADLKGKIVSYPSHTALAAAIMPQYYLYTNGIDINRDIRNQYVGSQESSIMNVYLRKSSAGATWPPPWRLFQKDHPTEASELKLIWKTPHLLNNSVMVRDDVPKKLNDKLQKILIGLGKTPEGKAILAGMETAQFYPANNADYEVVRAYIQNFEKVVRPVESDK